MGRKESGFIVGTRKRKRERDWGRGIFVSGVDRKDWKKNLSLRLCLVYIVVLYEFGRGKREEGVWQSKSAETHLVGVLLWDAWYIWVYDRECVSGCGGTHEVINNFNKVKFYGRPHVKISHLSTTSFRRMSHLSPIQPLQVYYFYYFL